MNVITNQLVDIFRKSIEIGAVITYMKDRDWQNGENRQDLAKYRLIIFTWVVDGVIKRLIKYDVENTWKRSTSGLLLSKLFTGVVFTRPIFFILERNVWRSQILKIRCPWISKITASLLVPFQLNVYYISSPFTG